MHRCREVFAVIVLACLAFTAVAKAEEPKPDPDTIGFRADVGEVPDAQGRGT